MRHNPDSPNGIMDYLFINIILWGKENGYKKFCLGMAPMSGFQNREIAPLWNKIGLLLFRYGENFYNFKGLRNYKDKFEPVWHPKYIASDGGFVLPKILSDIASLISGGVKGIITK